MPVDGVCVVLFTRADPRGAIVRGTRRSGLGRAVVAYASADGVGP